MNKTITIKQYMESQARNYRSIANEFNNYSPKNELYSGYAKMCEKILHDLSDETLEQLVVFRKFNYCGECARYNRNLRRCKDRYGNVIQYLKFENSEACDCFKEKE